jgi:hypothetical protein
MEDTQDFTAGSLDFSENLIAEVIEKRKKKDEEKSSEPSTVTQAPAEPASTTATEMAPEPPTWRDEPFADADDVHGFLRGKKKGDVDKVIREAERAKQEAERARNELEKMVSAQEVAIQQWQERFRRESTPPPQTQSTGNEEALDEQILALADELMLAPEKGLPKLKKLILEDAKKVSSDIVRSALEESRAQERKAQETAALEDKIAFAAAEAFSARNIPQDRWLPLMDYVMPAITKPGSEFMQNGGPLNVENYVRALDFLGIAAPSAPSHEPAPVAEPKPTPKLPNPPGHVSTGQEVKSPPGTITISDEDRFKLTQMYKSMGYEGDDLERLIQKAVANRGSVRRKVRAKIRYE